MSKDRTIRVLLALIVIFLGLIALRPILQPAGPVVTLSPVAYAADGGGGEGEASGPRVLKRWQTALLSTIPVSTSGRAPQVHALDQSGAFLLQYSDHIEVYKLIEVDVVRVR